MAANRKRSGRIILLLLIIAAVLFCLWEAFLKSMLPQTKRRFDSYAAFAEKVPNRYFADGLAEGAENVRYYMHKEWRKYAICYGMTLSGSTRTDWLAAAKERYAAYPAGSMTLYQYEPDAEKQYLQQTDPAALSEVTDTAPAGFYRFAEITWHTQNEDAQFGILCNDETGEIIEYYTSEQQVD